jgi:phosphoenolpyruvate-protein kinase (PTS system EI component)
VALLTQEIGIPAISGVKNIFSKITAGDRILVDGFSGKIIISPDEETEQNFLKRISDFKNFSLLLAEKSKEKVTTGDGTGISVMANIDNRENTETAIANGADGIGLYRTETLFFSRKVMPSEDELFDSMYETLEPVGKEKPVTLRLADIGGDKKIPFLHFSSAYESFLGKRGVRLLLDYPEFLNLQFRAFLRISEEFNAKILVPMITFSYEMKKMKDCLEQAAIHIGIKKIPPLGAMIEIPAAALCIDDIAEYSDFFSIGSNDLTQYTMAAGRENPHVNDYFADDHEAVFKLIKMISKNKSGKPVAICGRLAGKEEKIPELLNLGIRELSVVPPLLPFVKDIIRNTSIRN